MKKEISLDIKMSKEEIGKIKGILRNAKGLRHYTIQLNNGDYLDLVEYKDFQQLETNWKELKEWLKANDIHYADAIPFRETLRKMQELESNKEGE